MRIRAYRGERGKLIPTYLWIFKWRGNGGECPTGWEIKIVTWTGREAQQRITKTTSVFTLLMSAEYPSKQWLAITTIIIQRLLSETLVLELKRSVESHNPA